ncbi:hypothetical protein GCM10022295_92370 [Streptomyces osmaniensis]|uniref:Uncharacterized protein n=1 Tax=Streptomyces osmaniensis TaxID=593134 RepID=A0ABP6Z2P1_9ACTN
MKDIGRSSALERFLETLHAGGEVSAQLDEIHVALQTSGDLLGVYGHSTSGSRSSMIGSGSHGFGTPMPAEPVYLCPGSSCSRWWLPTEGAAPPECEVYGQQLCRDRL